jgi:hypothetical protein
MHESGLHYYDPRMENGQLSFVNAVAENMSCFTKREVKGAMVARSLYKTLDRPSMKDFKWIMRDQKIKDSPVTLQDVNIAIPSGERAFLSSKELPPEPSLFRCQGTISRFPRSCQTSIVKCF